MAKQVTTEVVKTVSVSMLGGYTLQVDGNLLTDEINRSQ